MSQPEGPFGGLCTVLMEKSENWKMTENAAIHPVLWQHFREWVWSRCKERREEGRGLSSRNLRTLELQNHRPLSSWTIWICLFGHTSCTSSSPPASFHPICSWKKICWGLTLKSGVLADAQPLWFPKVWGLRQTRYRQRNKVEILSVVVDSHQPLLRSRQAQSYLPGKGTQTSSWW